MSRLSLRVLLMAVAVAPSCREASPDISAPSAGGGAPMPSFWIRNDASAAEARICSETRDLMFDRRRADVLLLLDRSESMASELSTGTRYSVVSTLLSDVVGAYEGRIRFGFQPFPDTQPCPPGYAVGCCAGAPTVPVADSNAASVRQAIGRAAPPSGATPTAEAFRQARAYFASVDDGVSDRYVLLATDGRPSCDGRGRLGEEDVLGPDGTRVAGACRDALLEVDALVASGVRVIVLAVGSGAPDEPGGPPPCLEEIARHGRGPAGDRGPDRDRPFYLPVDDQAALERALRRVFTDTMRLPCLLVLDLAPVDPGLVAIDFDGHEVPRSRTDGWDYESLEDPRSIRFFGEYCRRIDRFQVDAITVRSGCPPCVREAGRCE